jgi:hypothetical protein
MGEERRHNFRPTMPESNRMCRNGCNYLPFSLRWLHADSLLKVSQGTKESLEAAIWKVVDVHGNHFGLARLSWMR